MKLLTYDFGTGPRAGVLRDGRIIDVSSALGTPHTMVDVRALLEFPDSGWDRANRSEARPLGRARSRGATLSAERQARARGARPARRGRASVGLSEAATLSGGLARY